MDKIKYSKNAIIDGTLVEPEIVVAEFTDQYTEERKQQLVVNHNFGLAMLLTYQIHRDNMHIDNVAEMLKKMEEIYYKYEKETFQIKNKKSFFWKIFGR